MVAIAVTFFGTAFFASRKGFVNSCPRLKKSAIGKNRRNFRRSGGIGRHRRLKISRPQAVPVQFWSAVPQSIPSRVSRTFPAPLREDAFLCFGRLQKRLFRLGKRTRTFLPTVRFPLCFPGSCLAIPALATARLRPPFWRRSCTDASSAAA